MCLGLPARMLAVVDAAKDLAEVEELSGRRRRVSLALLRGDERPAPGDWVMIHAGLAVGRVDEAEAIEASRMLDGFGELMSGGAPA